MPFSRKEIEEEYFLAPFPGEAGFAAELREQAEVREQQERYRQMRLCMDKRQMALVDDYLSCVGSEIELCSMHYFEQGWLAREKRQKK